MIILAVSGSLKSTSTNTQLIRAAANLATPSVQFRFYEGLADLPQFSPDRDTDDAPATVRLLREALDSADAVFICTPEYAFGMPGSLKNALDWTVSSGELMDKPVAALSASPNAGGGARAHASLLLTLTALSALVPEDARLIIPQIRTKLDANGHIQDASLKQALGIVIDALASAVAARSTPAVNHE